MLTAFKNWLTTGNITVRILIVVLIVYCLAVGLINPYFFSAEIFLDFIRNGAGQAVMSMGVLLVMISGGIDVSFLAIAISSSYISTVLCTTYGWAKPTTLASLLIVMGLACLVGVLLGCVNGLVIYIFKLPTFITTLATQSIFHGALATFVGTKPVTASRMPRSVIEFGTGNIFEFQSAGGNFYGLSWLIIPIALAVFVTWFILYKTVFGRRIFALGSNSLAAKRCGVNIFAVQMFVYAYTGFLAGVMGIIYAADVRWVNPITMVGDELIVIAAVLIGGAKLSGGSGSIAGTLLGMAMIVIIRSTLVLLGISSSWNDFFIGAVILLSVAVSAWRSRKESMAQLRFDYV